MSEPLTIQFDPSSLMVLNVILALMMFGVSLTLKPDDFKRVLRDPRPPLAGLVAQFFLLPAATCLFVWALDVPPGFALGMILVASCPGGTFSNLMTWLGRGNAALSVSMTAVSSVAATVMTPLNFAFFGWLNPATRGMLTKISVGPGQLLILLLLVLGVPLLLGMWTGQRFPRFVARSEKAFRLMTLLVLLLFVGIVFSKNYALFIAQFNSFFWLVVAHNSMALALGAAAAWLLHLKTADRRAVTLEVGIQNSGLGLVILFNFMPDAADTMLITAFWGVWHMVSGLSLARIWSWRSASSDAQNNPQALS